MNKQLTTKAFKSILSIALALTMLLSSSVAIAATALPEELYQLSIYDAMIAESSEIESLVTLTPDDKMVTFNKAKDKVLLLAWHRRPEMYEDFVGKSMPAPKNLFTFADRELGAFYKKNKSKVTDWTPRLEQLIGLPPNSGYTHVTAFWVSPDEVVRPAYVTDPTAAKMTVKFDTPPDAEYKQWFDSNIVSSYYDYAYPWTRLGYTYDWADNGEEYGLTEFFIFKDSPVSVAFTKTTEEFLDWVSKR